MTMSNWFCLITLPDGTRHVLMLPDTVDSTQRARTALKTRITEGMLKLDNGDTIELPGAATVTIASARDWGTMTTQRVPKTELQFDGPTDFPPAAE